MRGNPFPQYTTILQPISHYIIRKEHPSLLPTSLSPRPSKHPPFNPLPPWERPGLGANFTSVSSVATPSTLSCNDQLLLTLPRDGTCCLNLNMSMNPNSISIQHLLQSLTPEILDAEEESFLLFSQSIPSQNLGFVDSKATHLDFSIAGRDLSIRQSPTILSSNRGGGTTGAVVWKITPLFASWLCAPTNILFTRNILHPQATVLELGCGISGIIGLTLGPQVASYILTDQSYVMKLLTENLTENARQTVPSAKKTRPLKTSKKGRPEEPSQPPPSNITAKVLDWEEDQVSGSLVGLEGRESFDVVIACDCIYNDALIDPLVRTCADAAKLRILSESDNPTVVVVAQQLRSAEVFESWLKAFHSDFRVWRLPDEVLIDGLKSDSGFVIHIGVLR